MRVWLAILFAGLAAAVGLAVNPSLLGGSVDVGSVAGFDSGAA